MRAADPDRGRFRSFLLGSVQHLPGAIARDARTLYCNALQTASNSPAITLWPAFVG